MSNIINIKNINNRSVIEELWKKAEYSIHFRNKPNLPKFNWNQAIKEVKPNGYLEHICCKVIKVIILNDTIDISRYDQEYGFGKAEEIIDKIFKKLI